jgi:hypothetical protein
MYPNSNKTFFNPNGIILMKNNYLPAIFTSLILSSLNVAHATLTKEYSSGSASGTDYSADSRFARSNDQTINLLTGTAAYHMNLFNISCKSGLTYNLNLDYSGAVEGQVKQDNSTAPTGNSGLGWHMAEMSIYVDPKATVDQADDAYFLREANGSISQILRFGTSRSTYTYQIKNHPYLKITARQLDGRSDIFGWKITYPDGTIYQFGMMDQEKMPKKDNAARYVNVNNNLFECGSGGFFYYQWDLYTITDVNGGKITFVYFRFASEKCISRTFVPEQKQICYWWDNFCNDLNGKLRPPKDINEYYEKVDDYAAVAGVKVIEPKDPLIRNIQYLRRVWKPWPVCSRFEFYVVTPGRTETWGDLFVINSKIVSISSDNGEEIDFEWWPKGQRERGTGYYQDESHCIGSISLIRKDALIEKLSFTYSGDHDEISVNAGTNSEKRLLTGITSTQFSGRMIRSFKYSHSIANPGQITKIIEPMSGKITSYEYGAHQIHGASTVFTTHVIDRIIQSSAEASLPEIAVTYSYPVDINQQAYDEQSGVPYWGEVSATSPAGRVVTKFELDKATNKFGEIKSVDKYSTTGTLVSSKNYDYELNTFGTPPDEWFFPILTKISETVDGVTGTSGTPLCSIDPKNGMASQSWAKNSDGTTLVAKQKYAYEIHPAEMGTSGTNQLSQIASTKIFQFTSYDPAANPGACNLTAGAVVKASYTVWAANAAGKWQPTSTYGWKQPINSSGLPTVPFQEFNESNRTANGWVLMSTINKYDEWGNVQQMTDALGRSTTYLYGDAFGASIAKVVGAKFDECGVFPGDYYRENGWEQLNASVTGEFKHFGESCVKLENLAGPIRNFPIDPTRDYIASAWVKVTGKLLIDAQYRNKYRDNPPPAKAFPILLSALSGKYAQDKMLITGTGKWEYVELPIKASSKDHQGNNNPCIRLVFSNLTADIGAGGNIAYLDDIRFYPKGSQVVTTFYDQKWRKPIVTVGVDGKPSQRVEYDELGRPAKWYKYKTGDHDVLQLAKKQEYHLVGELDIDEHIRVLLPNGDEAYSSGNDMNIQFLSDQNQNVTISILRGGNWSVLPLTVSAIPGVNTVNLSNLLNLNGTNLRIKIESVTNSSFADVSDGTFTIYGQPPQPTTITANLVACVSNSCTQIYKFSTKSAPDPDGDQLKFTIYLGLGNNIINSWSGNGQPAVPPDGYVHYSYTTSGLTCTGLNDCNYSVWAVSNDGILMSQKRDGSGTFYIPSPPNCSATCPPPTNN